MQPAAVDCGEVHGRRGGWAVRGGGGLGRGPVGGAGSSASRACVRGRTGTQRAGRLVREWPEADPTTPRE